MTQVGIWGEGVDFRGHLAAPDGEGPWPGVVMVHDVLGFRGDVRDRADELAGHGYLVLAPSLYSHGRAPGCVIATMRAALTGQGVAFADIDSARAWLVARPDCTGKVGVLGFCIGGDFALACAPRFDFAAAAVNYGLVRDDAQTALAGSCPMVGSWGAHDRRLRGSAERAEAALTALGVPHDVKEYDSVGHSYLNDLPRVLRGSKNPLAIALSATHRDPAAVEDTWRRIHAFFGEHLGS